MAAAVFFALKQAIYASRQDAKMEGWVQLNAPATPGLQSGKEEQSCAQCAI